MVYVWISSRQCLTYSGPSSDNGNTGLSFVACIVGTRGNIFSRVENTRIQLIIIEYCRTEKNNVEYNSNKG